jgi:hypothetical protein
MRAFSAARALSALDFVSGIFLILNTCPRRDPLDSA